MTKCMLDRKNTSEQTKNEPLPTCSSRQLKFSRPAALEADNVHLDTCQQFLDSLEPVAMMLRKSTREVVACNKTAKEQGVTIESICSQSWANHEVPCSWCRKHEVWEAGMILRCQTDGNGRFFDMHWVPFSEDLCFHYIQDITEQKQVENELKVRTHDLGERDKELRGLLGLSKLMARSEFSSEQILQQVSELLPPSWHYPELTCGKITVNHKEYRTANYVDTAWKQSSDIIVSGVIIGMIEVALLEEMPQKYEGPFLREERDLINAFAQVLGHYLERHQNESRLRETNTRLIEGQLTLETKNTALSEIIEHVDREKKDTGFQIKSNIERLVVPMVSKLENLASETQKPFLSMLRSTLDEITSPFISKLERDWTNLTPREAEICNLIKNGLSSKDIAQSFNTSESTVRTQRKAIRKKLGLAKSNTNLATYLHQV